MALSPKQMTDHQLVQVIAILETYLAVDHRDPTDSRSRSKALNLAHKCRDVLAGRLLDARLARDWAPPPFVGELIAAIVTASEEGA